MHTISIFLPLIVVILEVKAVSWRKHQTKPLDPGWHFAIIDRWATLFSCKISGARGRICKAR
jgi:hypothetical protein